MTSELLLALAKLNLVAAAAVLAVILLRRPVRAMFGARLAYLIWLIVPAATIAVLIPARTVIVEAVFPAGAATTPVVALEEIAPAAWDPVLVLAIVWLAGVLAMAGWLLRNQLAFLADERRGRAGPAVVGVLRPRIVTPSDFEQGFNEREREVILAHEHTHIVRADTLANSLVALTQCLFWFNPLIHVGAKLMRIDQELACDAQVVERHPKARRTYAAAMLKAELADRPLPLGCYWPAGTLHPLTERVAMLKHETPGALRRAAGAVSLIALFAGAGFAAWAAQPERVEYVEPQKAQQELPPAPPKNGFVNVPEDKAGGPPKEQEPPPPPPKFRVTEKKFVPVPKEEQPAGAPVFRGGSPKFVPGPADDQTPPAPQQPPAQKPDVIGNIVVEGNARIETGAIRSKLLLKPGDAMDPARVHDSMRALFATGLFADVQIVKRGSDLVVKVIEKPAEQSATPARQGAVIDPRLEGRSLTLQADSSDYYPKLGKTEFTNPRMKISGSTISADKVALIDAAKTMVFSGNVVRQEADGTRSSAAELLVPLKAPQPAAEPQPASQDATAGGPNATEALLFDQVPPPGPSKSAEAPASKEKGRAKPKLDGDAKVLKKVEDQKVIKKVNVLKFGKKDPPPEMLAKPKEGKLSPEAIAKLKEGKQGEAQPKKPD